MICAPDVFLAIKLNCYLATLFSFSFFIFGSIKENQEKIDQQMNWIIYPLALYGAIALLSYGQITMLGVFVLFIFFSTISKSYLISSKEYLSLRLTHLVLIFFVAGTLLIFMRFAIPVNDNFQIAYLYSVSIFLIAEKILDRKFVNFILGVAVIICLIFLFSVKESRISILVSFLHMLFIFKLFDRALLKSFSWNEKMKRIKAASIIFGVLSFVIGMLNFEEILKRFF